MKSRSESVEIFELQPGDTLSVLYRTIGQYSGARPVSIDNGMLYLGPIPQGGSTGRVDCS